MDLEAKQSTVGWPRISVTHWNTPLLKNHSLELGNCLDLRSTLLFWFEGIQLVVSVISFSVRNDHIFLAKRFRGTDFVPPPFLSNKTGLLCCLSVHEQWFFGNLLGTFLELVPLL